MHNTRLTLRGKKVAAMAIAAVIIGVISPIPPAHSADKTTQDPTLDAAVMASLDKCRQVSPSCGSTTQGAYGVLVFPKVTKADVIIGGAGGKGALVENGKITGYYSIGAASAGIQLGVENASQVYVFRTADSLAHLKSGSDWKVGADAGVTVVSTEANSSSITGNILAYVFNTTGLQAGVSLDVFDVWKTSGSRPS